MVAGVLRWWLLGGNVVGVWIGRSSAVAQCKDFITGLFGESEVSVVLCHVWWVVWW